MTPPTATYRLQLREGMDLDGAAALVPYLADLGVSHLYLAPIFTAASGSTHGYDIVDPNAVDPVLGGRPALERLSAALRGAGLGLILDIVPNHTAFSLENAWLRDVLRHGPDSPYAGHFDIFWDTFPDRRLRLPWRDGPPEPFARDDDPDGPVLVANGLRLPVAEGDAVPRHWRLADWRTEAAAITHRRFFTVTGLIGMRVEDAAVFEDMHRLTFELVEAGLVDGLRVDHVDGLADPAGYLKRLRARLPDTPVWIEKILTGDEPLPDWPIQGTTGYEAARAFARVLTNREGAARLSRGWDFGATLTDARRQIVETELLAEVAQLTGMLAAARPDAEWGREHLREAVVRYLRAFPRYRSYATDAVRPADAALIRDTCARAAAEGGGAGALPLLEDALLSPEGAALRLRLQQVTGAAVAKAQEDTAFYRHVPYLAANEVGAEPDAPHLSPAAFHDAMTARLAAQPQGLTLTSSHDTKRAEDARARLLALSHAPEAMADLLALVPEDVPHPWRLYLAQSAWAAAPAGDLAERLADHVVKAAREAKRDTYWTRPDEGFERRLRAAARAAAAAIDPLPQTLRPLAARADGLALAQAALKLTVPGVPDIYQGTERGSFLLTDPDNRRRPDFAALAAPPPDGLDARKQSLTRTLLRLRRERSDAFAAGAYVPREAPVGVLSFQRGVDGRAVVVTVSLDGTPLAERGDVWPLDGQPACAVAVSTTR